MHGMAAALLERETLDAEEIKLIVEGKLLPTRVNPPSGGNATGDDVQQVLKPEPSGRPGLAPANAPAPRKCGCPILPARARGWAAKKMVHSPLVRAGFVLRRYPEAISWLPHPPLRSLRHHAPACPIQSQHFRANSRSPRKTGSENSSSSPRHRATTLLACAAYGSAGCASGNCRWGFCAGAQVERDEIAESQCIGPALQLGRINSELALQPLALWFFSLQKFCMSGFGSVR